MTEQELRLEALKLAVASNGKIVGSIDILLKDADMLLDWLKQKKS